MTDEAKVADVLSGLLTISEDLADAKTKEQKAMWGIEAKVAMGEAFALINDLLVERDQARAEVARLDAKCTAIGKYVAICKQHKRNYLRAVKWFMANTKVQPKDIPEPVYITLRNVAERLIAKAQRAAQEVKS